GRHLRARLPAQARGADGRNPPPARGRPRRRPAGVRDPERRLVTLDEVPGRVSTSVATHGETTLVVERDALVEACEYLRDKLGFNFLSDISATDYLGWGGAGVSGYIGTPDGRNLNAPMTQGYQQLPQPKPKRFAMNYHLLALRRGDARRLRVQ